MAIEYNKINYAILGCGRIASRNIEAISKAKNSKLIAVCDIDVKAAQEKASEAKVPYFTDYNRMLSEHPEIDVVIILTPSGKHYQNCIDILKNHNVNLLIEKPFVLTLSQGYKLKELSIKKNISIFPIYQNRFNKAVQRVKKALTINNELGDIRIATIRVRWCRTQEYYDQHTWRGTYAMDGGAITNQGIHYLDLLRYLAGEVRYVHAKLATFGVKIEAEDTAVAILEFENGALGTIEITTAARPQNFEASVSCVCSKGLAEISGIAANKLKIFTPNLDDEIKFSEKFTSVYGLGHNKLIYNISEILLGKKAEIITIDDGLKTIQLLHAIYKSNKLQKTIEVQTCGDSGVLGI